MSGVGSKGAPQVALGPPTGPPPQPSGQLPAPGPGLVGKSLQPKPGCQLPSALWQGVRSMPDSDSNHGMPTCIIE